MNVLSDPLLDALRQFDDSSPRLASAVRRMSAAYRDGRPTELTNEDDAIAYVLWRLPATYAAVAAALRMTASALPDWEPRSLLDVGAGPATAAWAAREVFPSIQDVCLVEHDGRMRTIGKQIAQADPLLREANWVDSLSGHADLVVASYALGEMDAGTARTLWDSATDVLVVVEPGTPAGYATVIEARRAAVEAGGRVAAPCPHSAPCPIQSPAWCHFSQRLPRSGVHRALKDAKLSWEDEKYSYVAVSRRPPAPASARIIGYPRYRKRLAMLPLCAEEGIVRRAVPKSDPRYKAARDAKWGDPWPE